MITKAITKHSLVLVDAQGRSMVSLLKERIKIWELGFDAAQESYHSVDSEQAKKLAIGLCDKREFKARSEIVPTGVLIAEEPAELFSRAMVAGEVDDVRFYANGVALIGGEHTLVCSNAYVLFKANVAHTSKETVIIPIKLIKALIKVAGKKGKISVFVEKSMITLESNGFAAQAPIIGGDYPKFKAAYPQNVFQSDTFIEDSELEVKKKQIKSHRGAIFHVDYVKRIKAMGFSSQFVIESTTRPVLFKLGDSWDSEALLVPSRF